MSEYLCEELIVEIFTRLPSKSLIRFRSVSKSLRSCIDSPSFIKLHASRSPKSIVFTHIVRSASAKEYGANTFCTVHTEDQLPSSEYTGITPVKYPRKHLQLVSSCNGIICMFQHVEGTITLWNPSIMRQLTLPDCPRSCVDEPWIGIGFDPITDDNKIVSIPRVSTETPFFYSMKTSDWRPISSPMPSYCKMYSGAFYINGVLHWVVGPSKYGELRYILTFDLNSHVFGMIRLPKPNWETTHVTTIEGCVAVISRVIGDTWIWVRRDGYWSLVFKSKTNQVKAGLGYALELTYNGNLLLTTFCENIQVYNRKTGARSTLVNFNDASSLFNMYPYVETLHLLDIGTACDETRLFLQEKKRKRI